MDIIKFPVGEENFELLRRKQSYYIDKTRFIADLMREDFYHAFIAGLFSGAGYLVSSNDENGIGRADVIVKDRKTRKVIIIEVKQSGSEAGMEQDSREALQQIDLKQYASKYLNGYKTIQCYGASFYRKKCFIKRITIAGQGEGSVFEMEQSENDTEERKQIC